MKVDMVNHNTLTQTQKMTQTQTMNSGFKGINSGFKGIVKAIAIKAINNGFKGISGFMEINIVKGINSGRPVD